MASRRNVTTSFEIDGEKAVRIGHILLDQFYNKKGFFEDYEMPEYILPHNLIKGSKEHALWLTYVISVDYMTDARARAVIGGVISLAMWRCGLRKEPSAVCSTR